MWKRQELARGCLVRAGTLDSLEEAVWHMLEIPKLQGYDTFGLRDTMPSLLLRLERDQECWKFVGCRPRSLDRMSACLLLKLKHLVDMCHLKIARQILTLRHIPFDIGELIEAALIRSPQSARLRNESPERVREAEKMLVNSIRQVGTTLHEMDDEYMSSLFDPAGAPRVGEPQVAGDAWNEAFVVAFNTDAAWREAEGVLDLLSDARACAAQGSEDEIREKLEQGVFGSYDGSEQRFDEVMGYVSMDRIWAYLDWAVEDASYLGPPSARPSVKHLREAREARAKAKAEALLRNAEGSTSDDDAGWLYNIGLF